MPSPPAGVTGGTAAPPPVSFAPRIAARLLAAAAWGGLALAGIALAGLFALAIVLASGPVEIGGVVRLARGLAFPGLGVTFAHARLGWDGHDRALALTLDEVRLRDPAGQVRDDVARLAATFPLARLATLDVRPTRLAIADGALSLRADAHGIGLAGFGPPAPPPDHRPPHPPPGPTRPFAAWGLEHLRLEGIALTLAGPPGGAAVAGQGVTLALDRVAPPASPPTPGAGGWAGQGRARLVAGGAAAGLDATLAAATDGERLTVRLDPAPAALLEAAAAAAGHPIGLPFDGRLGVSLHAALGADLAPRDLALALALGPGAVHLAGGTLALSGATATIAVRPASGSARLGRQASIALRALDVGLAGAAPSRPGGVLHVTASGRLAGDFGPGGRLEGELRLGTAALALDRLGAIWPPGLAHDPRLWLTRNLADGEVTSARARLELASADGLAGLGPAAGQAHLSVRDATVTWLAPIPPARGVSGEVEFPDLGHVAIRVTAGHERGLDLAGTRMTIAGLDRKEQPATIEAQLSGPVADLLWVLGQKRLHLSVGSTLPVAGASGSLSGRLVVRLPLDDRVTLSEIGLRADATLHDLHLERAALGRPIDDGDLALHADKDGLALDGSVRFAGLPLELGLDLDFRALPPDADYETAHITADLGPADLARAVPPDLLRIAGRVPVALAYGLAHDGAARLRLSADLAPAAIASGLGWSKPAGAAGHAEAELGLADGRLDRVGPITISAPGLRISADGTIAEGRVAVVAVERLDLGASAMHGRVRLARDGAIAAELSGRVLDLAPLLAAKPAKAHAPPRPHSHAPVRAGAPGPVWSVAASFGQVRLARRLVLTGVRGALAGRGQVLGAGWLDAGGPSPLGIRLLRGPASSPDAPAHRISIRAGDGGALLAGLDVTDRLSGGQLTIDAGWPAPGGGVAGQADLRDFTLIGTPAAARLLSDLTIYGLAARRAGGGMAISRLALPFRLQGGTLSIEDAHAWQPALGLTATGTVGVATGTIALKGTIVPAYALNTLPGRLPLIGRLFSPEPGGGVFSATYRIAGSLDRPIVSVNPLAALVPGVLRKALAP